MRQALLVLHRYAGLATALFLFCAGLTGAVISWEHEIDRWLNPQLFKVADRGGGGLSPLALVAAVEQADPRVRVSGFPLHFAPGQAAVLWVDARVDPGTGRRYQSGYNQVFLDPASGRIMGRREWGKVALDREHLMSFLYKLHFSLHVPEFAGTDRWGVWFMGGVASIWLANTVLSFFLSLPARRKLLPGGPLAIHASPFAHHLAARPETGSSWWGLWKKSWQISWRGNVFRINFDLHRASGLWFLGFLLILSFTSFSLNLYREAFYPVMSLVSKVTPGPFETRRPTPLHQPVEPLIGWERLIERGTQEAASRAWKEPAGDVFYADNFGIQAIRFFTSEKEQGPAGLGARTLYYDASSGEFLGEKVPWKGSAADKFVQLQFPLHSGRILGVPGRILVSLLGLIVALLSVTGTIIWWRKKGSRRALAAKKVPTTIKLETT
jgi:uncharacterized iron-regulated membrane protein